MLEFSAHEFYQSTSLLQDLRNVIRSWSKQQHPFHKENDVIDRESALFVKDNICTLMPHLEKLNAKLTKMSCARLVERLSDLQNANRFADIATSVESIIQRLRDELSLSTVFVLEADKQKYYCPANPLFGGDIEGKFPSSLFEIDEAAKCLGLGRPTAAVFHLMRMMEIGIRAVARCLGIPDPMRAADRNWGNILRAIKNDLDARSGAAPTKVWKVAGDKEFFESAYASLDAVRVAWRNTTMHVGNKYTDDEAEHVFVAVRGFMMKLALRCGETGDPKA